MSRLCDHGKFFHYQFIPSHECYKRFSVIEMISRQEMEEAMEVIFTNGEWEEIKREINMSFYELIGDDVDEFSFTILREIRNRSDQIKPKNKYHSI